MAEKEYLADDRFIISDDIKKMSSEELKREIEKFEKERGIRKQ